MRKSLPRMSLLLGTILLTTLISAQQADRFAYSMTDVPQQNGNWVYLRILDMETGTFSGSLLNGTADKQVVFDAFTKKQLTDLGTNKMGFSEQPAFNSGVAALAYDSKHGRIYYTPMFIDQLRYYDIKSQNVYYVTVPLTNKPGKSSDQGNIITRMVIASDGNGYAMTNDGMQLISFTTGKKPQVVDLGSLVDDQANKGVSIHNSCSSFGGDMIADDNGNLYVFSARNHVFKVNIESKVATHLGVISGLPNGFTINGAAVNANNQVIVGSAMESTSLFVVDAKTWAASPLKMSGTVYHTSDLANSNLLASGDKPKATNIDLISKNVPVNTGDSKINIYPNPVTNSQFTMQFNDLAAGSYTVRITDVTGRQVIQQVVNVGGDKQYQVIKLPASSSAGVYLVKVSDPNSKSVFSTKIVVQ
ncbi:MAG TPA: T9SS type A sorting domain-containing protein [Chitinophagaceae bacterium]|nr:T9SS type A sorting domain-containing protein [Chitinophagaceae bacterium]